MTALLSDAFAAGMVSTVNPCGFAMLPAYLGVFLGDASGRRPIGLVAGAVSSGFLIVFTAAGLLVGVGVRAVVTAIPWMALAVGSSLVVVGVAQLGGRRLLPYLPGPRRVHKDLSLRGMFAFGVSYAVASLSCTLPVRPIARRMDAIAGWTMTIAGSFIVWYWATVLTRGAVTLGANRAVRWIDQASAWVTGIVGRNALPVAVGLIVLVGGAYLSDRRYRTAARADVDGPTGTEADAERPH